MDIVVFLFRTPFLGLTHSKLSHEAAVYCALHNLTTTPILLESSDLCLQEYLTGTVLSAALWLR